MWRSSRIATCEFESHLDRGCFNDGTWNCTHECSGETWFWASEQRLAKKAETWIVANGCATSLVVMGVCPSFWHGQREILPFPVCCWNTGISWARQIPVNPQEEHKSEPFAIGPVQFSWPRGVAENWFTKPDFGSILSIFPRKNSKNRKFTKFSSVQTPEIY